MSDKHRKYFNEKAPIWDELMGRKPVQRLEQMIKSLEIRPASTVLDAGTGTGVILPFLKDIVGPSGQIVALDFAQEMLLQAKQKNGDDSISYVIGDLTATPFDQNFFDEIICYSCFPHILDKGAAIQEMMRILKAGGRATICHTSSREDLNRMHQSIGGVVGNDMLPDDETMIELFKKAGFKDIINSKQTDQYLLTAYRPE